MSGAINHASPADRGEILRRSRLAFEEVYEEMRAERKERRHRKKEERLRKEMIRYPWRYETEKPMTEPPDINYRTHIINDQKWIDLLFERGIHFTQRCLEYQEQDVFIEKKLLEEYSEWTEPMQAHALETGDGTSEGFFREIQANIMEDIDEVRKEGRRKAHLSMENREKRLGRSFASTESNGCSCNECVHSIAKARHDLSLGSKLNAYNVDENGVPHCYCDSCNTKRSDSEDRHDKLERRAESKGLINWWSEGLPGCVCRDCWKAQTERKEHMRLREEAQQSGNTDFQEGVAGCQCYACRRDRRTAINNAKVSHHDEEKREVLRGGRLELPNGMEGCDCCDCGLERTFNSQSVHKELKRKAWLSGNGDFEKGVPDCSCVRCNMNRSMRDGGDRWDSYDEYDTDEDEAPSDTSNILSPSEAEQSPSFTTDSPASESSFYSIEESLPVSTDAQQESPTSPQHGWESQYPSTLGRPSDVSLPQLAPTPPSTAVPRNSMPTRIPMPVFQPGDSAHASKRRCTYSRYEGRERRSS